MHNKLVEILEQLKIPIAFQEFDGESDEYIVFDVYHDEDSDFYDNENLSETYYITLNYWFKSKSNIKKYKKIKSLLKDNDFVYTGGKDLISNGYLGRNLDFKYIEYDLEGE
ncbi:MAG: hypothetical protein RR460_04375 [Clostridium sp.]